MPKDNRKILDAVIRAFTVTKKDVILFVVSMVVIFGSIIAIDKIYQPVDNKTLECTDFIQSFALSKAADEAIVPVQSTPDGGVMVGITSTTKLRMLVIVNDKIAEDLRSRLTLKQKGICIHSATGWKYNVFNAEVEINNNQTL
jgi:hypothetical protein